MRAHTVGINQAVPSQRVKLGADCIKPFNISHFFPLLSAVQERERDSTRKTAAVIDRVTLAINAGRLFLLKDAR